MSEPEIDTETVTHWGVRFSDRVIRWNPSCGGTRPDIPYTEEEARADQLRSGGQLVTRTETTVIVTAPWMPASASDDCLPATEEDR